MEYTTGNQYSNMEECGMIRDGWYGVLDPVWHGLRRVVCFLLQCAEGLEPIKKCLYRLLVQRGEKIGHCSAQAHKPIKQSLNSQRAEKETAMSLSQVLKQESIKGLFTKEPEKKNQEKTT
jgi:hypothetical protein